MEILKRIVLLVLVGFIAFSLKMPKDMKAIGALELGSSLIYAVLIGCAVSGLTIRFVGLLIFKNFSIKSVVEVRGTV